MQQGFTLLELLIVIAIIGLLASVILVSYNGYTDKARLANTLQWASGLSHSLFYEAVGVWSFNEGSGHTTQDESGKGNNGTLGSTGGSDVNDPVWRCANTSSGYTPSGEGCSLEFDGANDYVSVGDAASLNMTNTFTISGWIYWNGGGQNLQNIISKMNYPTQGYRLFYYSSGAVRLSVGNGSSDRFVQTSSGALPINAWTHLAGVHDGAMLVLYIDGNVAETALMSGTMAQAIRPVSIGSYSGSSEVVNGLIDEVRIFKEAFTQTQIQQLYAQGLPSHQNLAKK